MTCEKIWWLLRHGERWLKPEKRGAGIMVRLGGLQGHPQWLSATSHKFCLGHMPRLQCSLLLRTLGGRQTLEALRVRLQQCPAAEALSALTPLAAGSAADVNGPLDWR